MKIYILLLVGTFTLPEEKLKFKVEGGLPLLVIAPRASKGGGGEYTLKIKKENATSPHSLS